MRRLTHLSRYPVSSRSRARGSRGLCGKPHCLEESDNKGGFPFPVLRTGGPILHGELGLMSNGHEELPTAYMTRATAQAERTTFQDLSNLEGSRKRGLESLRVHHRPQVPMPKPLKHEAPDPGLLPNPLGIAVPHCSPMKPFCSLSEMQSSSSRWELLISGATSLTSCFQQASLTTNCAPSSSFRRLKASIILRCFM